jgi:hypothetical protein
MTRTHPDLPWCRYADDGLVHCRSEQEAQALKVELQARLTAWSCIRQRPRSSTARTGVAEERIRTSNSTFSNIAFDHDGSRGLGTTHCSAASTQRSVPRRGKPCGRRSRTWASDIKHSCRWPMSPGGSIPSYGVGLNSTDDTHHRPFIPCSDTSILRFGPG